ncbi:MAG: hypothetical protein ACRDA7_00675 [Metamycoplasmataceae bacterium]
MKEIGNKFAIIGTNPDKYIENYLIIFTNIGKQEEIDIDKSNNNLKHNNFIIKSFNSDTTLRQNIDCWVSLGLFVEKDNKLIKIYDEVSRIKLYEIIKSMLIVDSDIKKINEYRDTIIFKLMYMLNLDVIKKYNLKSNTKIITYSDIEKEIGSFENKLIKDKKFTEIIKIFWGEENE